MDKIELKRRTQKFAVDEPMNLLLYLPQLVKRRKKIKE
jgi:hypothetical protein